MAIVSNLTKQRIVALNYQGPGQRGDVCARCSSSRPVRDGQAQMVLRCDVLKDVVAKLGKCDALSPVSTEKRSPEETREPQPL